MKKFIFNKFAGLQAYRLIGLQAYMNSVTVIFQQRFKPPQSPPCIDSSTHHVRNTCGKPWDICPLGRCEILLEGEFSCGCGNLRRSDFGHSNLC